jgi:hypothetical protein
MKNQKTIQFTQAQVDSMAQSLRYATQFADTLIEFINSNKSSPQATRDFISEHAGFPLIESIADSYSVLEPHTSIELIDALDAEDNELPRS